ncbi:MAG: gas vesicle protein [Terrabacter sp.]
MAALELADLTGKEFEGIVGIRKVDDEWHVEIEVLEMERIPSTTDVLAVYEVSLDASGELVGYERTARYVRGDAREDRG